MIEQVSSLCYVHHKCYSIFYQNSVNSKVESFVLLSLSILCSALGRQGAVIGRCSADLQVTYEIRKRQVPVYSVIVRE